MKEEVDENDPRSLAELTEPAMKRAAKRAREVARLTNTKIVISRDGKVVEVQPDEIDKDEPGTSPPLSPSPLPEHR